MDIQEIYENEELVKIENELVESFPLYFDWRGYGPRKIVKKNQMALRRFPSLLLARKRLLNEMFVMDESSKELLAEFNEALRTYLTDMWQKAKRMYEKMREMHPDPTTKVVVEAKCYFRSEYPKLHPIQFERAKKIWNILTCSVEKDYNKFYLNSGLALSFYYDGTNDGDIFRGNSRIMGIGDTMKLDNWNMGFDNEMTKDMHLIYAVFNLHDFNLNGGPMFTNYRFSLPDFVWVREFATKFEIKIDTDPEDDSADSDLFNSDGTVLLKTGRVIEERSRTDDFRSYCWYRCL